MRTLMCLVAFVVLVVSAVPVSAGESAQHFNRAVVGEFEFPWTAVSNFEMVVWPADGDSIQSSNFGGTITAYTELKVVNRNLSLANVDLLTGERVFAYGAFHVVGEGEGSQTFCDSLTIYLLPREGSWGQKKFTEASVGWVRVQKDLGMSIWPTEERTGGTYFAGELTTNTSVKVHGRNLSRTDVDLLDGEYVACVATFRNEGQGEGSRRFYDSLDIWILPRSQY